ncbi:hypothetical protein V7161_26975 [Neobacillus drentensis]|uniref:hypothetical protein n=1 Tax=Neobacillus drentensis TaxID=220684 RepID=UPI0030037A35
MDDVLKLEEKNFRKTIVGTKKIRIGNGGASGSVYPINESIPFLRRSINCSLDNGVNFPLPSFTIAKLSEINFFIAMKKQNI